jgi:ligand-binding sensor domain-containing protein
MAVRAGVLYAVHRGTLRSWKEGDPGWKPTGLPTSARATAVFVSRDATLYAGGRAGVWREKDGSWTQLWPGGEKNDEVRFLGQDALGHVLVGTRDGLLTLSLDGAVLARDLRGRTVTSAADGPEGRLWVGTWDGGLHLRVGRRWFPFGYAYGLPDDTVSGVVLDREGLLWVGLYGHGVVVRTEAEAAAAALAVRSPERLNGQVYHSVADAARRNMVEGRADGGVARLEVDGQDFVYFGGRQVSPPGVGAFGPDGTSARRRGGLWLLRTAAGADVALPPMPGNSGPTAALLDSRGRLWVGTDRAGLHVYADGAWATHGAAAGLDDNPVRALAEDTKGRIWAATSPFFDAKEGRYARKNLHRFDGSSWRHWSPAEGLGYWASRDVRTMPDGSVWVATNGGISELKGEALRNVPGPEDGSLRADVLVPLEGGRLVAVHSDAGVTWSDASGGHRVTSRNGLFTDDLDAAAADGRGNVWLVAADGRAFIAPLSALREVR